MADKWRAWDEIETEAKAAGRLDGDAVERARIAIEAWKLGRKLRKGKRLTFSPAYWPPWVKR